MALSLYTPKEASLEFQMDITTIYRTLPRRKIRDIQIGGVAPSAYRLIQQNVFPSNHYGGRTLRISRDDFFSWLSLSSVRPAKKISVADVSSFIDNIILSGGIYHEH